jgi:hypothetical protein
MLVSSMIDEPLLRPAVRMSIQRNGMCELSIVTHRYNTSWTTKKKKKKKTNRILDGATESQFVLGLSVGRLVIYVELSNRV